jgi:hypothetical protein
MIDCISSLFSQYQLAVSNASAKLPVLTGNMIIINTYIQLYSISIECGDTDKATQYLEQLQEYMNLIGCDCSCNDCGNSSEPTEVFPLFTEPMPNYVPISYLEANNITIDSNTKVPTNKAVITYVNGLFANYYTKTQIDALIANYYTKTESDANYVFKFNIANSAVGNTLNTFSGRITVTPDGGSGVATDGEFTYTIINNKCVANGLVLAQISDQSGLAPEYVNILSVQSYAGGFVVTCFTSFGFTPSSI